MNSSAKNTKFVPLLGVLEQIQFWLESAHPPGVLLATPSLEEFQNQKLPAHCIATKRTLQGPRVPIRGQRQIKEYPYISAHWPNDTLVEGMKSMLAVVVKGEPVLRVADYQVQCQPGDFLFIPSQLPKWDGILLPDEKLTADTYHELILFWGSAPDPSHLSMRITHYRNQINTPPGVGEAGWVTNPLLCQLFGLLDKHLQSGAHGKSAVHLLTSLVLLLQEEIEKGHCFDSTAFPSDSLFSQRQDPIEQALQYIQNHLNTSLSIDVVSRWVGLSRSSFTRRFRAKTNQTFNHYLREQRLEQTKILLAQTDLSIVQISERVGMLPVRLHQLFPEKYGCTPREFRLSQRKSRTDNN